MDEKQTFQRELTAFDNCAQAFFRYGDPGYAGKLFSALPEEKRRKLVLLGLHDMKSDVRAVAEYFLKKLIN